MGPGREETVIGFTTKDWTDVGTGEARGASPSRYRTPHRERGDLGDLVSQSIRRRNALSKTKDSGITSRTVTLPNHLLFNNLKKYSPGHYRTKVSGFRLVGIRTHTSFTTGTIEVKTTRDRPNTRRL